MDYLKKILTAEQTRQADQFTIENEPISSIELMERAAIQFSNALIPSIDKNKKITIVCGPGNNGGDGFAVCRLLQAQGYKATAYLIKISAQLSADCQTNFDKIKNVQIISNEKDIPSFDDFGVIIDAIFGSGLTRKVEGIAATVINSMNQSKKIIFSIDLPSGLFADEITHSEIVVRSNYCISFQRPKLSFFLPDHKAYLKSWSYVDIGLDEEFIQSQHSNYFVIDKIINKSVKPRSRQSHKGTYGHALIIAGSYGKMGAAVLSSKSCLRIGAGLVSCYIPKCGYQILQTTNPEIMCATDDNENWITQVQSLDSFNAIGIGPGMGTHKETQNFLKSFLESLKNQRIVFDADALNMLGMNKDLLNMLPQNTILTPHPREFERLAGKWENSLERLQKLKDFCQQYQLIVVLKDAFTMIGDANGNVYFNNTGNAGMATAGSGDVLTGIITGLLAQGYSQLEAALIGVHYHGLAGDTAKVQKGENALIASDIIDNLRIEPYL